MMEENSVGKEESFFSPSNFLRAQNHNISFFFHNSFHNQQQHSRKKGHLFHLNTHT
ncbi:unnamed protein product [Meloidogyne enterolobii]|uniref:Uncharacterized protein n=1 Tax=Meloidogyne enterolobii TaxID=390850 RepID=A0ACB0YWL0_MELEN